MPTELEQERRTDIFTLNLRPMEIETPRPFVLHPKYVGTSFANALFYFLVCNYILLIVYNEAPAWHFPLQIGLGVLFGSVALNLWRKHPANKFNLPSWLGSWLLRLVEFILLPAVAVAGSTLILVYCGLFSGENFFLKHLWLISAEQTTKSICVIVSIVAFLGINVVKASPVLSHSAWKRLAHSEFLLLCFLTILSFLEHLFFVVS